MPIKNLRKRQTGEGVDVDLEPGPGESEGTYSLQTDSVSEYTRLKPHQGLSEALTNFINRVQLRWGGDAFEEIRRLGDRELTKIHAVEEGE